MRNGPLGKTAFVFPRGRGFMRRFVSRVGGGSGTGAFYLLLAVDQTRSRPAQSGTFRTFCQSS